MATIDLKNKLINKIQASKNNLLLEELYRFMNTSSFNESKTVYKLNDEQISAINEARENIKNGDYFTNDQAKKDIDEWLKK